MGGKRGSPLAEPHLTAAAWRLLASRLVAITTLLAVGCPRLSLRSDLPWLFGEKEEYGHLSHAAAVGSAWPTRGSMRTALLCCVGLAREVSLKQQKLDDVVSGSKVDAIL